LTKIYNLYGIDRAKPYSSFLKTYLSDETYQYLMTTKDKKSSSSSTGIKCEVCGIIFTTEQDKEQHKKLEHKEHQRPSGVS
jgi:hypothetical protein